MQILLSLLIGAALACEGEHTSTASTGDASASGEGKSHCNMPQTASTAALPADGTHITLNIAGMHCGSCADQVYSALLKVEGVKGAKVDLSTATAEIAYDSQKTSTDKLIAAVATTGKYTATAKN